MTSLAPVWTSRTWLARAWTVREPAVRWLLVIGLLDLVATAGLHAQGKIVELNPLMAPLVERSEWLFVLVKGATLAVGGRVLDRLACDRPQFVTRACWAACGAYVAIWLSVFLAGR